MACDGTTCQWSFFFRLVTESILQCYQPRASTATFIFTCITVCEDCCLRKSWCCICKASSLDIGAR